MPSPPNSEKIDWARFARSLAGTTVFFALCMFLPAGTWRWERGWLFVAIYFGLGVTMSVVLWRINPEIFAARINAHRGTKRWDKVLLGFFFAAVAAIFVVAAFDDARFHWSRIPDWVCIIGYALLVAGFALVGWAQAVNRFFEVTVRLQTDRGQHVIDTGPYAYIRHPGYACWLPMSIGIALALGSLWALIPAAISCAILMLRAHWEDRMLHIELSGYKEYAERVRYKMLPGIW